MISKKQAEEKVGYWGASEAYDDMAALLDALEEAMVFIRRASDPEFLHEWPEAVTDTAKELLDKWEGK